MLNYQSQPSRLNQTQALQSTKSQTLMFSSEIDETRIESIKQSRKVFMENEKKKLQEQIDDLTTTVNINKELMSEIFTNTPKTDNPKD